MMQGMTGHADKLDEKQRQPWLRKLDRAIHAQEKARRELEELVADARTAGVPATVIAERTRYSREWVRQTADRVDAARAAENKEPPEA